MLALSFERLVAIFRPTWQDISYGMDRGLLSPDAPAQFARYLLTGAEPLDSAIWALAEQRPDEPAMQLVKRLAASEARLSDTQLRDRWYTLSLLNLCEVSPVDPLPFIEEIWCHFDHPSELNGFIPYMPASDPRVVSRRTKSENLQAMRTAWLVWAANCRSSWVESLQTPGA